MTKGGDCHQRQDCDQHRRRRDAEGHQRQPREATRLLLFIGDVKPGHDGGGTAARAVERDRDRDRQPQALLVARTLDHAHQLLADQLGGVSRHDRGHPGHVLRNARRIGSDAVDQHDCAEQRHHRREAVEGDAGRGEADIVLPRLSPSANQHVLPGSQRQSAKGCLNERRARRPYWMLAPLCPHRSEGNGGQRI